MDVESVAMLMPARKNSISSDLTIETILEEGIDNINQNEVSPLSPVDDHRSMWGALLDKARPMSPRGFRSISKLAL